MQKLADHGRAHTGLLSKLTFVLHRMTVLGKNLAILINSSSSNYSRIGPYKTRSSRSGNLTSYCQPCQEGAEVIVAVIPGDGRGLAVRFGLPEAPPAATRQPQHGHGHARRR